MVLAVLEGALSFRMFELKGIGAGTHTPRNNHDVEGGG